MNFRTAISSVGSTASARVSPLLRVRCLMLLVCGILLASSIIAIAEADALSPEGIKDVPLEYRVKATLVAKFIKGTRWPDLDKRDRISVTFLGQENELSKALSLVLGGATAWGKSISYNRVQNLDELRDPQVLVVGESAKNSLLSVFDRTRGKAILTVSEIPNFATEGGMVGFLIKDNRVRYTINKATLKSMQLQLSEEITEASE